MIHYSVSLFLPHVLGVQVLFDYLPVMYQSLSLRKLWRYRQQSTRGPRQTASRWCARLVSTYHANKKSNDV
ncbi:unnamed protein product [Amoebophrya sp. A25]|nr:unnamed protein product [Amoebophrya sp. A25]|eukprot:GSA25T00025669001.1